MNDVNTRIGKKEVQWLSTEQDKKMSLLSLGICCIMMGGMAPLFTPSVLWVGICHITGMTSIVYDLYSKSIPHKKFFNNIGLYVGEKEEREYPRLKKRSEEVFGQRLTFKLPAGLSSKDFKDKESHIIDYFAKGSGEVKIYTKNGYLFIDLYTKELGSMYRYEEILIEDIKALTNPLDLLIGYSLNGLQTINLSKAAHLLICGETGGGKSTLLRSILTFLLSRAMDFKIKFHLMDFKEGVEFQVFENHPAVVSFSPNVDEAEKVLYLLKKEISKRYRLFKEHKVKDIESYNRKFKRNKLDYQVVVTDEFADFYINQEKQSFRMLEELLAKSRACGIHFIIATQRPDADVINGKIKANVPARITFRTGDALNSRMIIDRDGAENLRGEGHALMKTKDGIVEIQSLFLHEDLVEDYLFDKSEVAAPIKQEKAVFIPKVKVKSKEKTKVSEVEDLSFLENLAFGGEGQ